MTCAAGASEKFVLAPTDRSTVDTADAEAELTTTGYSIQLPSTSLDQAEAVAAAIRGG